MRLAQADGTYQYRDDLREESRPGVEEHADNDRQHGIRNDIYIEYVVCHHNGRYHTVKHDKGEEQRETALAVIIVLTKKVEIEHETKHEDTDV